MRTNRTWLVTMTDENKQSVATILESPIMQVIKKELLLKQMEVEKNTYSLDFIADRLSTAHIQALLALGVVIDRIKYFIEVNPALATVNTPIMFPGRTIPTEWDEDGKVTATRILKINEYFYNQIIDGRFFIRLAKAPIDSNQNIDADELPNSEQVKQFITENSAHIIGYYSQMEYNALAKSLNVVEV